MKKYYPAPFSHWLHGQNFFNLISPETRRVMRFEPNRFVIRAEGHPTLDPFEKAVNIAKEFLDAFGVSQLFSMKFTSVRTRQMKSLEEARSTFAETFLTDQSMRLLKRDALTDFGVAVERTWLANTEFQQVKKPDIARLKIREHITVAPVSYKEIGEKWLEFRQEADNTLYRTTHVAPRFAMLADICFEVERRKIVDVLKVDALWRFYDWAKSMADKAWSEVEGEGHGRYRYIGDAKDHSG